MLWLLKFKIGDKSYFLHNGFNFEGGESEESAKEKIISHTAKSISIGGFEVIGVTPENLSNMIGGVPYPIISVSGGLIPFQAVEIVKEV